MLNFFKKKKIEEVIIPINEEIVLQELLSEVEEPIVKTKTIIESIVLINNKTDKEYIINSDNNFGLTWVYQEEKGLLVINQYTDFEQKNWRASARFYDFSMIKVIVKTIEI